MKFFYEAYVVVKEAVMDWIDDKASQLGAALAFYSILSIAPLLIIAIAIAALVFDEAAARDQIVDQIDGLVGKEGAEAVETMITHARKPKEGILATVLGVVTLLLGASGVFGQLQDSLNTIWEVPAKKGGGIWSFLRTRFLSFAMVLGTGFLLLVSLILSAAIAAAGKWVGGLIPMMEPVMHLGSAAVTFVLVTLLFAAIYKFLPDAKVAWSDVWVGALLTALLFTIGKLLIGLYLGKSTIGSAYGAAGSLVVLIVWIYYSAQILFLGAELTQVYARRYGSRIVPEGQTSPARIGTEESRQPSPQMRPA